MKSKLAILTTIIPVLSIGLFLGTLYIGDLYHWSVEDTVIRNLFIVIVINVYNLILSKKALTIIIKEKVEGKAFAILGRILSIGVLIFSVGALFMAMIAGSL